MPTVTDESETSVSKDGILAACQRQSQPQQHTEHERDAEEDQPARRLGFQITFPPVFIHAPESS